MATFLAFVLATVASGQDLFLSPRGAVNQETSIIDPKANASYDGTDGASDTRSSPSDASPHNDTNTDAPMAIVAQGAADGMTVDVEYGDDEAEEEEDEAEEEEEQEDEEAQMIEASDSDVGSRRLQKAQKCQRVKKGIPKKKRWSNKKCRKKCDNADKCHKKCKKKCQQCACPATSTPHLSLQQVMTCPKGAPASQTLCMSGSEYDQIVSQITAIMDEYKTGSPCTNNNCKLADFAGCVLRAAGHDFMDFRSGVGGSDGCLRFDDPDNKGLINCLKGDFDMNGDTDPDAFNKTLHDVYKNFCDTVSLADFIVMAGEAVMGFTETSTAVNLKQDFHDRFMYGRSTRGTCADAVALPNPANGCAANEVTFLGSDAFGMTWRQTAALMGVHTIGKASLQNSGYSGWWQDEQNVARFNNNYYISIVNHGWEPAVQTSGKSQWGRSDTFHDDAGRQHPEMMLNTDMCLVYNNVFAESSNCCAWERFDDLHRMNITETHDGTPIYCGFKGTTATLSSSFGIERGWCCVGQSTDCAPRNGDSLVPQGPAQDAVHAFAADQDLWLGEFKSVWKLATEKGAGALKALEQSCGAAPTTPAPPPNTGACRVTVYEHWPEGITAGIAGLEAAEQAWGGHFPTGAKQVLQGTGNFPLQALSNLTSSVKVEGACCKAYGYASADCSGKEAPQAVESTTQLLPGLPAGVVTPATGISSVWGCNDCAQCVKVTQQCP